MTVDSYPSWITRGPVVRPNRSFESIRAHETAYISHIATGVSAPPTGTLIALTSLDWLDCVCGQLE